MMRISLEDSIENINSNKRLVAPPKYVDRNYLFNIGGIISGFYVGYSESRGVSLNLNETNMLLFSPLVVSLIYSPVSRYLNDLDNKNYEKYKTPLGKKILKAQFDCEPKKDYSELDSRQKEIINRVIPIIPGIVRKKYLENKTNKSNESLTAGIMSAGATALGYSIGKIVGQYL